MEYLQYSLRDSIAHELSSSRVLILIINGIPSIPEIERLEKIEFDVLNLIINGIPSILPFLGH